MEEVRGELARFLSGRPHPVIGRDAAFVGASFEVYMLSLDGIAKALRGSDLTDCLVKTGNWHHQILQMRKASAIGLSAPRGDVRDSLRISGLFVTPLASKVDRAIEWIDRQRPEDHIEAFFFIAPAFQIHAFLLRGFSKEEVLVVSNRSDSGSLKEGAAYPADAFLSALKNLKPVTGIVCDRK